MKNADSKMDTEEPDWNHNWNDYLIIDPNRDEPIFKINLRRISRRLSLLIKSIQNIIQEKFWSTSSFNTTHRDLSRRIIFDIFDPRLYKRKTTNFGRAIINVTHMGLGNNSGVRIDTD